MALRASASAFAVAFFASVSVRASDPSGGELVRVEYAAPPECPGQHVFEAALAEHLGTGTFARFGELARTLSVAIELEPQGFRAKVELVDRQGQATERTISAPTCEQAMRAIALVAALAARSQVEQADRERNAETEAKARTEQTLDAPPPLPPHAAAVPAPRAAPTPAPARPAPVAPQRESTSLVLGASAGLGASTGVGPGVAPGLFVSGRAGIGGAQERSVVLSAIAYDTFQRSLDVADVRFSVLKGRLELCPIEPRISARWFVSPCAGLELGSQTGRSYEDGDRVETSHTAHELWMALTLAMRLRWRADLLELGIMPELGVPLRRNQFVLAQPERPVYDVPRVTVGLSASVGLVW